MVSKSLSESLPTSTSFKLHWVFTQGTKFWICSSSFTIPPTVTVVTAVSVEETCTRFTSRVNDLALNRRTEKGQPDTDAPGHGHLAWLQIRHHLLQNESNYHVYKAISRKTGEAERFPLSGADKQVYEGGNHSGRCLCWWWWCRPGVTVWVREGDRSGTEDCTSMHFNIVPVKRFCFYWPGRHQRCRPLSVFHHTCQGSPLTTYGRRRQLIKLATLSRPPVATFDMPVNPF